MKNSSAGRPRLSRGHAGLTAVAGMLLALACTERAPTLPERSGDNGKSPADANAQTVILACTASRTQLTVTCAEPQLGKSSKGSPARDIVYGGQNTFVKMTTSNVAYNSGTGRFTFDATLQNLLQQPIGTTDGTTLSPNGVRVFFSSGPTVTGGSGPASVLPDGFATFTAGGQAFYQYNEILAKNATAAAKTWTLIIAPTVDTFTFLLLVSAPVQFPNGYIEINGQLPGASLGLLHPGNTSALVGVVKNQLGVVVPGAVITWGTTDPNQASVDSAGVVTGVRYGTPAITATSGGLNGSIFVSVTGATRTWNGSLSTNWATGGNWNGGYTPAIVDTANVPTGVPNFPALTGSESIGGLIIADAATLNLGAFNLDLSASALTGQGSGGVTGTTGQLNLNGTSMNVSGRFSLVNVTGTYSQNGDILVTAPITIPRGLLSSPGYLSWIKAQ